MVPDATRSASTFSPHNLMEYKRHLSVIKKIIINKTIRIKEEHIVVMGSVKPLRRQTIIENQNSHHIRESLSQIDVF